MEKKWDWDDKVFMLFHYSVLQYHGIYCQVFCRDNNGYLIWLWKCHDGIWQGYRAITSLED